MVEDVGGLEEELGLPAFLDGEDAGVAEVQFGSGRGAEGIAADEEGSLEGGAGGVVAVENAVAAEVEVFAGLGVEEQGDAVVAGQVLEGTVGGGG